MAKTTTIEFLGTGRRKTAIARVRLATGSGKITVNGRAFDVYFPLETLRATVSQPLTVTGTADKLDVRVNVVMPLAVDANLRLASTESEVERAPVDDAECDVVLGSRRFDLLALLEDELLLAMPYAPKHDACPPASG